MSRSKILVAVSSPWASERLVPPVSDLAARLDASVVAVHVTQSREEDEHESDARQRGEQTLKVITDALAEANVPAEGVLLFSDDVPKAILNTAKARHCTIIAMGVSGKSWFARWLGGDMPTRLTRQSDLPVVLCPANWKGLI